MPYKKNSGDSFSKKPRFDSKDKPYRASGKPGTKPHSRTSSGPKKEGFSKSRNSEFNTFDKDELAPPRFLAPKGKTGYGSKPGGRDGFKRDSAGRDDSKKGFAGKKYGDDKRFSDKKDSRGRSDDFRKPGSEDRFKRPGGDDRFKRPSGDDRFKKSADDRFKRPSADDRYKRPTSDDRYKRPGSDDRFKKPGSDDRFKKSAGDDRGKRSYGGDRFNKSDDKSINDKKPFRPKYDPEVKIRKSYKERKQELVGPEIDNGEIRLNRYLANSGICSRREADEIIKQGLVSINGEPVTEMGYKVKREDVVRYDGRKILPEPFVYILMNKPKDFITTTEDDKGRKTVMDLLADKVPQRVYPIGRLDRNTTGVLLLTNDGEVSQALTHPSFQIKKLYHVVLDKKVSGTDLDKLVNGVELEDGQVFADAASFVETEDRRHIGIEIHSGKNRVVRRMFEALGYEVEKLDRVSMGIFTKKDLPRGKWRYLSQSEVGFLMKLKSKMP